MLGGLFLFRTAMNRLLGIVQEQGARLAALDEAVAESRNSMKTATKFNFSRTVAPPCESEFVPVRVRFIDWLNPTDPLHEGERILWADGSIHNFPEDEGEYVTVLRLRENAAAS
jgi:hypothetical protein